MKDDVLEADNELEKNNFSLAREKYKQSLIDGQFNERIFTNMSVAEEQEKIQFLNELAKKYPNQLLLKRSLAANLDNAGFTDQAILVINEVIKLIDVEKDPKSNLLSRIERLRISCHKHNYSEITIEDFLYVWELGNHYLPAKKLRTVIVKLVYQELKYDQSIATLQKIINSVSLPSMVIELFNIKAQGHEILNRMKKENLDM